MAKWHRFLSVPWSNLVHSVQCPHLSFLRCVDPLLTILGGRGDNLETNCIRLYCTVLYCALICQDFSPSFWSFLDLTWSWFHGHQSTCGHFSHCTYWHAYVLTFCELAVCLLCFVLLCHLCLFILVFCVEKRKNFINKIYLKKKLKQAGSLFWRLVY